MIAEPIVLGLCSGTHDSSAALIAGGRLIGLVEEERLTREKHTRAYPERAVDWLFARADLTPEQVTHVAYNYVPGNYLTAAPSALLYWGTSATSRRAWPRARSFAQVYSKARRRFADFRRRFPSATVAGVDHHLAHGLYGLAATHPMPEHTAVLVVDSLGERATTTISSARRMSGRLRYQRLEAIDDPASLGYVYGAVTRHLGWRKGDEEGTVMALAGLGDPARFRELFRRAVPVTESGFTVDLSMFPLRVLSSRWPRTTEVFSAETCAPRHPSDPIEEVHRDLAAALQERTEQVMVHLARRARRFTGASSLVLSGGVALNCVAVGRICAETDFETVSVPPAPGDSGTSAGAALATFGRLTARIPAGVAGTCYLGPDYPDFLPEHNPGPLVFTRPTESARFVAEQLAEGRIVGLFRGRLEAGPRALGNRSILASPLNAEVVDRLNATVKFREPFRPFAPVVLVERAGDYFTLRQPSPFMSIASGVTDLARRSIPAVVHVNGTARVQTVEHRQNPFLCEVLAAFAELTGHPVLINTSLNVKGEPICGTPEAALDCLTESGLDALLLEDWWITKKEPK